MVKPMSIAAAAAAVIVVASVLCIFASFLLREYSDIILHRQEGSKINANDVLPPNPVAAYNATPKEIGAPNHNLESHNLDAYASADPRSLNKDILTALNTLNAKSPTRAHLDANTPMALSVNADSSTIPSVETADTPTGSPKLDDNTLTILNSNVHRLNATNWHPRNLQHFMQNYGDNYESMLLPMVKKCANERFGVDLKDKFSKEQKERLCTNVETLAHLSTQILGEYKKLKMREINFEAAVAEINKIMPKIREVVWKDLDDLKLSFRHLLTDELAYDVDDELIGEGLDADDKPTREDLDKAFNNTFFELHKLLRKDVDSRDTNASRRVAYRLLCISEQMKTAFNGDDKGRPDLALQQFAGNLAVYSVHLDKGRNEEEIRHIANEWLWG